MMMSVPGGIVPGIISVCSINPLCPHHKKERTGSLTFAFEDTSVRSYNRPHGGPDRNEIDAVIDDEKDNLWIENGCFP
jgi:hypothetical protein